MGIMEKDMATHSSVLIWRIPWTQDPGGLQSTGLQRDTKVISDYNSHFYFPVLLVVLSIFS